MCNVFLAGKDTSERMKGGNTDNVYTDGDDRRKFAESLREQHPSIVKVVWKFGRWQHQVDYSGFKNIQLIKKRDLQVSQRIDNYGMVLSSLS